MSMFPLEVVTLARLLLDEARERSLRIVTAESCTGGLVAGALTAIAGSSAVVDRGFVTYSNEAKMEMVGVPQDVLARFGAVSEPTARAMAEGAKARSRAQVAVSVTGIAGPGGGSDDKPVGLVHFAIARADGSVAHVEKRLGAIGRDQVRLESVRVALGLLHDAVTR